MAKTITLKDNVTYETLYPQTKVEAVYDSDGISLDGIQEKLVNLGSDITLVQGALNSETGALIAGLETRVTCNYFLKAPFAVQTTGDYECRLFFYELDGTYHSISSGWVTSYKTTDATRQYKVVFRDKNDGDITPSSVLPYVSIFVGLQYNYSATLRVDINQNFTDREQAMAFDNLGLGKSVIQAGLITQQVVYSANIHNSADAVVSTTRPAGPDWASHSINPNGEAIENTGNYNISYYIPVTAGLSYKGNTNLRKVAFYNSNQEYILYSAITDEIEAGTAIIAPENSAFIIIQYSTNYGPLDVHFGLFSENINVPYVSDVHDYDSTGNEIVLKDQIDIKNKELKVLLLGSSLGVNTIIQFPFLANSCGVNIVCGNMYIGSGSLAQWAEKCTDNNLVNTGIYTSTSGVWTMVLRTVNQMLAFTNWDIIILQRGAQESNLWTPEMSAALGTIIDHIRTTTSYSPRIMFNSNMARSVEFFSHGNRQGQIDYTKAVMITAKQMQDEYGLEVIPTALAIQNARNTLLSQYGTYDGGTSLVPDLCYDITHLDIGVGSYVLGTTLFEQLLQKRYDISMIANNYYPSAAQLATRAVWSTDAYTDPGTITNYFRIANACALAAINNPWQLDKRLPLIYPAPNTDPSSWDLDIEYS